MRNSIHLHLISDSTGETVSSVSRAAMGQFEHVEAEEHVWSLVRTKGQVEKVLEEISRNPGFVMYTISNKNLKKQLKIGCEKLKVPCVAILSRVISDLSGYLGINPSQQVGKQHELDDDYFNRVEAMNFSLSHDDGQSAWDLEEADIVLVGVSRTSKSPTTMYLAQRGYRTANIPFVPGGELPGNLESLKGPLIIGLTINSEILMQIRKNRMLSIKSDTESLYTDRGEIKDELAKARKLFSKHGWPVIDVSRKSVEETAAQIIKLYQEKKGAA